MQPTDYFLSYDEFIAFKFMIPRKIKKYVANKCISCEDDLHLFNENFVENLFNISYINLTKKRLCKKKKNYLFDFTKSPYYDSYETMRNMIKNF